MQPTPYIPNSTHPHPAARFARLRPWLNVLLLALAWMLCAASRANALTATPSTTEGPYYTFSSQNEVVQSGNSYYDAHFYTTEGTDNDLTHIYSTSTQCSGTLFLLSGTLVNTSGTAISGATIELWEADNNGIYWYVSSNSGTNNYAGRDQNFQGYGKTTTDSSGAWSFRTIKPGLYVGRIRHFHIKVDINGTNVLTTQFMFSEDSASFSSDNVAAPLVKAGTMSLVTLTPTTGTDSSGNTALIASNQLVVNYTGSTASAPTITTQPASQTVAVGGSATFSVVATSSTTLTYQWYKGTVGSGSAINGATGSSYTVGSATTSSAGSYYVVVTNATGSTTSSAATLTVNAAATAPTITTQPASQSVTAGSSVTFTVAATGSGTLAYQWYQGSAAISGATSASYTISSATAANAGSYTVKVSNSAGSVTSSAATLTVNAAATAPTITTQPTSQSVTAGSSVTFTVVATGSGTLAYQWYHGYTPISGATSASYTISSVATTDAGSYDVVVTNSAGSVTSSTVTLTVTTAVTVPAITTQPVSQEIAAGSNATFTVVATGGGTLSYQWYKDGAAISGATSSSYTVSAATMSNDGSYSVVVANSAGSITSSAAMLIVDAASSLPVITTQPVSQTAAAGASVTFSVTATGTDPKLYQWYKDNVAIPGAEDTSYTVAAVTADSAGSYNVVVTNSVGTATSNKATLTVTSVPVLTVRAGGDGQVRAGAEKGKLVFTRTGGDLSNALTFAIKIKGSAEEGADFTTKDGSDLGESLTFPAGAASLKVKLAGVKDGVSSSTTKTVVVKILASPTGAYTVGEPGKAKLVVIDTD